MTQLMELLYKYTREYGIYKQLNHQEYADAEAMEERNLDSLKESLNVRQLAVLERFQDAAGERQSIELEAMFRAAFALARELS